MDINCIDKCEYQTDGKCQLYEVEKRETSCSNKKNYECMNLI